MFDCVKDGRAAIRYIRANAKSMGIDPDRIAVGGGSAGGHVALGTALFNDFDHADEDLKVSCKPNALILLYAVLDTSKDGYGTAAIGAGSTQEPFTFYISTFVLFLVLAWISQRAFNRAED